MYYTPENRNKPQGGSLRNKRAVALIQRVTARGFRVHFRLVARNRKVAKFMKRSALIRASAKNKVKDDCADRPSNTPA